MMQPTNKVHKKSNRARGRKAEANARRKVAKNWDKIAHGIRYQKAAAKESCRRATKQMEEELLNNSGYQTTDAVKNRKVYTVPAKHVLCVSQYIVNAVEDLADAVYSE